MAFNQPIPVGNKRFFTRENMSSQKKPFSNQPQSSSFSFDTAPQAEAIRMEAKTTTNTETYTETNPEKKKSRRRNRNKTRTESKNQGNNMGPKTQKSTHYKDDDSAFKGDFPVFMSLLDKGIDQAPKFGTALKPTITLNEFRTDNINYNKFGEDYSRYAINIATFSEIYRDSGYSTHIAVAKYLPSIFARYYKDAMATVRNSALTTNFTQANFISYIGNVAQALEYYYTLDSILAFDSQLVKGRYRNLNVVKYQVNFGTFNIIAAKDLLSKYIRGLWFPPKFASLIRWAYQHYRVSELETSPVLRLVPGPEFVYDTATAFSESTLTTNVTTIVGNISSASAVQTATVLNQCYPDGRIETLPGSYINSTYDPKFSELWVNMPTIFCDLNNSSNASIYPSVASGADYMYFLNSAPEDSDGAIFAMHSIHDAGGSGAGYGTYGCATFAKANVTTGLIIPKISGLGTTNQSSKYTMLYTTNEWKYRCQPSYYAGMPDAHLVGATGIASTASTTQSLASPGFQRVFYDNNTAPTINLGELLDWLFNLKLNINN